MSQYTQGSKRRQKKPKPIHTAEEFSFDVLSSEDDLFRWFLLAYLLGKPIQSTVAANTWKLFIERKVDTPWAIADMPYRTLVGILHEGKYTRYQEVASRSLQTCMGQLIRDYEGSLMIMIESSYEEDEFSKRLQKLYGVGPKTAEIIMRETEDYFARRVE